MGRIVGLLLLGVLSFAGIMAWAGLLGQAWEHHGFLKRAVALEGELRSIRMVPEGGREGQRVSVRYRYTPESGGTLEGTTFRLGEQVGLLGWWVANARLERRDAAWVAANYKPGPVVVYHDPDQVKLAVLDLRRPAAPLLLMGLLGFGTGLVGGGVVSLMTHGSGQPRALRDGWVRLPPAWTLHGRAMSGAAGSGLMLVMAVPPTGYAVLFGGYVGVGFWVPMGTLVVTGLYVGGCVYYFWQWRRVESAELHLRPAEGGRSGVLRGEPFEVRLRFASHAALIAGGELRLVHENLVTTGSGKNRKTRWVTQATWVKPIPSPVGPKRVIEARGEFVIPETSPATGTTERYRLIPRVRLAFGPDYWQEFGLKVL